LLSAILLVVGLTLVGYGAVGYVQASTALSDTVEVDAQITETNIEEVTAFRGDTMYAPAATFEYRYQGATYTSDHVFPAGTTERYRSRETAESLLAEFPAGETVTAYVSPGEPGEAFLRDARSDTSGRFFVFGGFIALVGGLRLAQAWIYRQSGSVEL